MHYRLYDWALHWSGHRHAQPALFLLSLAESSFFPVPPDVLLISMTVAKSKRWLRYALICSAGSVVGGLVGYAIGWGLWEAVQGFFFDYVPGFNAESYAKMAGLYDEWNFWVVFVAGFTPIPYKIFTIAAGVARINLPIFLLASAISRAGRFFLVAGIVSWFGPRVQPFIEKYLGWLTLAFAALLVLGFWAIGLAGGH
ncbi:MAG: DedA family protein [bacterium]|nr:DedA family protein [bacterium]